MPDESAGEIRMPLKERYPGLFLVIQWLERTVSCHALFVVAAIFKDG
ncbi:hypothetical protein GIR22_10965 [Pseudomonas sp. CCM 7891]|uniref:Uncharacterized protein n=1 Tax=Pseudomonas karstica TaxID=1055468 RepID=A0A7X2RTC6_9PSED|nr:hypothetical protein [Pseudomonas karstica]MTD19645.1 hypothetical protein [Pseudomonas karstica]